MSELYAKMQVIYIEIEFRRNIKTIQLFGSFYFLNTLKLVSEPANLKHVYSAKSQSHRIVLIGRDL